MAADYISNILGWILVCCLNPVWTSKQFQLSSPVSIAAGTNQVVEMGNNCMSEFGCTTWSLLFEISMTAESMADPQILFSTGEMAGSHGIALMVSDKKFQLTYSDTSRLTVCQFQLEPSHNDDVTEMILRGVVRKESGNDDLTFHVNKVKVACSAQSSSQCPSFGDSCCKTGSCVDPNAVGPNTCENDIHMLHVGRGVEIDEYPAASFTLNTFDVYSNAQDAPSLITVERALLKIPIQSATSSEGYDDDEYPLRYSYDNNGETFFHSRDTSAGWAKYAIAQSYVSHVRVQNRPDCCEERMVNSKVFVCEDETDDSCQECGTFTDPVGQQEWGDMACGGGDTIQGSVVKVLAANAYLQITEVEIYGLPGEIEIIEGSGDNNSAQSPNSQVEKAYDGSLEDCYLPSSSSNSQAQFTIRKSLVSYVRILNRLDCCPERLTGTMVSVCDEEATNCKECGRTTEVGLHEWALVKCVSGTVGSLVKFLTENNKFQACEIQIFGHSEPGFIDVEFTASELTICYQTTTTTEPPTTTPPMRCEDPSIDIKGSGKDVRFPKIQYVTDSIEMEADVLLDCDASAVQYKWLLSADNTATDELSSNSQLQSLTLEPYTFPMGFVKICLEVIPGNQLDFYPQTECRYLDTRGPEIVASFKGVYTSSAVVDEVFSVDASSSYDPLDKMEVPEAVRPQPLEFTWSCAAEQTLPTPSSSYGSENAGLSTPTFCTSETPEIISSCSNKKICLFNPLDSGVPIKTWLKIQVNVTEQSSNRGTSEQMFIIFTPRKPPDVRIRCKNNCLKKLNREERLILRGSCENAYGVDGVKYIWSVRMKNRETRVWNEAMLKSRKVKDGIGYSYMTISADEFPEEGEYSILLEVIIPGELAGFQLYTFLLNYPPYGGNCDLAPSHGIVLQTQFQFTCLEWRDENDEVYRNVSEDGAPQNLMYEYRVFVPQSPSTEIPSQCSDYSLLGRSKTDVSEPTLIPIGSAHFDYQVFLCVNVLDKYLASNSTFFTVNILPRLDPNGMMMDSEEAILSSNGSVASAMAKQNVQSVFQTSLAVSSVLQHLGGDSSPSATERRIEMRSKMVDIFESITQDMQSIPTFVAEFLSESLQYVTSAPGEISETTKLKSSRLMKKNLDSCKENIDELSKSNLKRISSSNFKTVNNLLETTALSVPIANKEGSEKSNWNAEFSTETSKSLGVLSEMNLHKMTVGDSPIVFNYSLVAMAVQKTSVENMSSSEVFSTVNADFPNVEFQLQSDEIGITGTSFETNLYTPDEFSQGLSNNVKSIEIRDSDGNVVEVNHMEAPFRMIFEAESRSPFNLSGMLEDQFGFVAAEYDPSINGDLERRIVRTNDRNSSTLLCVLFKISTNASTLFEMFLDVNNQPSEDNYLMKRNFTATEQNSLGCMLVDSSMHEPGDEIHFAFKQQGYNHLDGPLMNYTFASFSRSCRWWSFSDEQWDNEGCQVSPDSTLDETVCECTHLTDFASEFLVAPNLPDFTVWANPGDLLKNPAVAAFCLAVLLLYAILAIWARRKDKRDEFKWSVLPLVEDELYDQGYKYELTVHTGFARNAGTFSRVFFILSGQHSESPIRELDDGERNILQRGNVDKFVMTSPTYLGPLSRLKIWHDNSGGSNGASWFLDKIVVLDIQSGKTYSFICNKWLAVDEDDGKINRTLHVAGDEDLAKASNFIRDKSTSGFTDGHIWFSVAIRPQRSSFTRLQRLTCCLSWLAMTMVASILWYERENSGISYEVSIGPINASISEIIISIQASLVTFPINFGVVFIFKKTASRERWRNRALKDHKSETSQFMMHPSMKWLAFFLAYAATGCALFTCVTFSLAWGQEKSNSWLIGMIFSTFQNIFFVQPLQVMLTVFLFVIIFKTRSTKMSIGEDEGYSLPDDVAEDSLIEAESTDETDVTEDSEVPGDELLKEARKLRRREKNFEQAIFFILKYSLFLCILSMVAYGNRNAQSYYYYQNLERILESPTLYESCSFTDFWNYLEEFFENKVDSSEVGNLRFSDDVSVKLGTIHLRQLRVITGCSVDAIIRTAVANNCDPSFSVSSMDDRSFEPGSWGRAVDDTTKSSDPWKYHPMTVTGALPYAGRYTTYPGSGYIAKFSRTNSLDWVRVLKNSSWIDARTRAVLLRMNLYNLQTNLFAAVTVSWEFLASGGAIPYISIQMPNIRLLTSSYGHLLTFLEIILFAIYIILFINILVSICSIGWKKFFGCAWNWIQCSIATCGIASIFVYAYREAQTRIIMRDLRAQSEEFFEMTPTIMWNEMYVMLTGCVVFLVCAKLLQLMEFNRVTRLFVSILKKSGPALAAFSLMFLVMFLAFAVAGNLLFGRHLYVFSTMVNSLQECGAMVMGKFSYHALMEIQPILGGFYFVWFMSMCYMVLMNVFMTILNESIADSGEEVQVDNFSSVAYLLMMLKESFGIGGGRARRGARPLVKNDEDTWNSLNLVIRRLIKFIEIRYGKVSYRRITTSKPNRHPKWRNNVSRHNSFDSADRRFSIVSSFSIELDQI